MEPRPARVRKTTPVLRTGSPCAQRQRRKVIEFKDNPNMDESRIERESEAHLGRNENGQPLQSTLASAYGGHQPSTNSGGNLPPNGRTAMHKMGIMVYTIHAAVKFHTTYRIGTVPSTYEYNKVKKGHKKEKNYPCLKKKLQDLLRSNTDVFAWTYVDMTRILRTIMVGGKPFNTEHKLNEYKHIKSIKRGLGPDRNEAACKEVDELTKAGILRKVKYQTWVANPVMVKKRNGGCRMCVDFTDINKACPKDCYPLSEVNWKVESLSGFRLKYFLEAYKGYHQIQIAKGDEDKTNFFTGKGVFYYRKIPFDLKNAEATYQRLVDKVHRTLPRNSQKETSFTLTYGPEAIILKVMNLTYEKEEPVTQERTTRRENEEREVSLIEEAHYQNKLRSLKAMQNQIDMVKNKLRNEMKTSIQTSLSNKTNEIKNMMASLLQMNTTSTSGSGSLPGNIVANPKGELKAITTRSGLVTDGPTIPTPPKSVNPEEDECIEETYMDPDLVEYTIKVPPPPKKLGLPDLIPTRMTLELANRAIYTPDGIARDVFVPVGKFTFPTDFVVVDYESDPRVPLILGRPFLRTVRALINVHGEEMILHCLEDLVSNKQSGNPTFLLHKEIASPKVTHELNDSKGCNFLSEELPDIDSFNDIHPYFDDDPLSGSTTYSSNSLLEEFTDELALITYPMDYDDNCTCDIESDLKEIEVLLCQEIESDANNFNDDLFDSKGEKIKESELLIDQLDHPCDILSEYDSFDSQDFTRNDDFPPPDNEDKVFNPGILIHEKLVKIITRVTQEKKLAVSYASLLFEDFDPLFYELLVFKEVPNLMRLLPFSSKNEEKVFKPGIYTFEKVHSCFLPELSHP
nr:reverse transcriptase domain-containing protein [Tanacetum cinerariifolium]